MKNTEFCLFTIPKNKIKAVWEITDRCNYDCKHCCSNSKQTSKNPLNFKKAQKIIKDLKKIGVEEIYISGGEPFILKDFIQIVKYACSSGIKISIATNCSKILQKTAKDLKKIGIEKVHTSLDGHNPEIHSKIRGDTFDFTVRGIKNLVKEKVYVRLGHVISKYSLPYIENMINYSIKLGVNELIFSWLIPVGRLKDNKSLIPNIRFEEFRKKFKNAQKKYGSKIKISLHRHKSIQNTFDKCPGGKRIFFINSKGQMAPCSWIAKLNPSFLSKKSIFETSILAIFKGHEFRKFRTMVKRSSSNRREKCPVFTKHVWENQND